MKSLRLAVSLKGACAGRHDGDGQNLSTWQHMAGWSCYEVSDSLRSCLLYDN